MKKRDYFLAAMQAGEHRRQAWVISNFSLISEGPEDWRRNPYPYRLVQTFSGFYFVNPTNPSELVHIEDGTVGQPLFRMMEAISLTPGDVPNLTDAVTTTYGNTLYNFSCIVYAFGAKIPFLTGRWSPKKVEGLIAGRMPQKQNVPFEERDPNGIYTDELLRFNDAMFNLEAYTQLCVPACSRKSMTAAPGIIELREQLLTQFDGRTHDPAVIAHIDKTLVDYQKAWMKGDSSMRLLIKDKSFSVVRKKLYAIGGAEAGLDDQVSMDLVTKSLSEGWQIDKFATLNTTSRAGSFNRGAQTELGGEAVKWLFRAASNMRVMGEDCGSKMGVYVYAGKDEARRFLGFTAILGKDGSDQIKITQDNVGNYLGGTLRLRSSMYCKFEKTDFCATCLGDRLSTNPNGLGVAVAETGSTFLGDFMSAMHGTVVAVTKLDWKKQLR
jgi:hypothetical protein